MTHLSLMSFVTQITFEVPLMAKSHEISGDLVINVINVIYDCQAIKYNAWGLSKWQSM